MEVKINPPPNSKLPAEKLDELIGGELTRFEKWFLQKPSATRGTRTHKGLLSIEKAILTTYILYLATKETSS